MTGPDGPEHRQLRELLGAFVLGGLGEDARAVVRAHLDGCAQCRAELAELTPLVEELRGVDPEALSDVPAPPSDLGARIRDRIVREREMTQARERREARGARTRQTQRQLLGAAAAVAVLALTLGAGTLLGRSTAPATLAQPAPSSSSTRLPVEVVAVRALRDEVQTDAAAVIAHTWGVEARFEGSGFERGRTYRAAFRSNDGTLLPAGEFLGTGDAVLTCNMQSALLRSDTAGFIVTDDAGREVLTADL